MLLFMVGAGKRVAVKTETIKLQMLDDFHLPVAGPVEWQGTVTDKFFEFQGVRRRLVANPSIDFWKGYGIWLKNVEVEVLD